MAEIQMEDAERDQYKEFAYRFGIERSVDINTQDNGIWFETDGIKIWKFAVHCPNAKAISFRFNDFDIPKGAKVFIYDV